MSSTWPTARRCTTRHHARARHPRHRAPDGIPAIELSDYDVELQDSEGRAVPPQSSRASRSRAFLFGNNKPGEYTVGPFPPGTYSVVVKKGGAIVLHASPRRSRSERRDVRGPRRSRHHDRLTRAVAAPRTNGRARQAPCETQTWRVRKQRSPAD
jgi:hypothetical protein